MKNIDKYQPYFRYLGVLLIALFTFGIVFRLLTLPSDKEIVIRNPIILRKRIISPEVEESLEKDWLEQKIMEKVDSLLEERLNGESGGTSFKPVKGAKAESPSPTPSITLNLLKDGSDKEILTELVKKYADEYNVSVDFALCVLKDESNFTIDPCGTLGHCDHGKAAGPWQFHCGTWQGFRQKMGLDTNCELRNNANESTRTAIWAFSTGRASHWASVGKGLCRL